MGLSGRTVGLIADLLHWPKRETFLFHIFSTVLTGNAISVTADGNQILGTAPFQNPPANSDSFTFGFFLRPGDYTLAIYGNTNADHGKIDWYIDDVVVVAGQDWYSASLTYNVKKTAAVSVKGLFPWHVLKGVVNGKNASSTNYYIGLTIGGLIPSQD